MGMYDSAKRATAQIDEKGPGKPMQADGAPDGNPERAVEGDSRWSEHHAHQAAHHTARAAYHQKQADLHTKQSAHHNKEAAYHQEKC